MRLAQFNVFSKIRLCLECLECAFVTLAILQTVLYAVVVVKIMKCNKIRLFLALFGLSAKI
jgi:hypothetical protein